MSEDLKSLALKACIDIAADYTKEEVEKFFQKPIQDAWNIGNEYLEKERARRKKSISTFRL